MVSDNTLLILLLALVLIGWFWIDTLRAREQARAAAALACRRTGVQLLDDTVALQHLWLRRNSAGRRVLERRYSFEFTLNGDNRLSGSVLMLGAQVQILHMEPNDLLVP